MTGALLRLRQNHPLFPATAASNFAVVQDVTVVGVLFAVAITVGIGITLSVVALLSVVFRERLVALMNGRPGLLETISRGPEVTVGLILMVVAIAQVIG